MRRLVLPLLLVALPAHAAEDGRGPRGFFIATGGGFVAGTARDQDGNDADPFFGTGGQLRIGEEALPGLTLGLWFGGGGGAGGDDYTAGVGGFTLQVGWRAIADLVLTGGMGVGGGSLTPEVDDGPTGEAGGALFQLGIAYELKLTGGPHDGFGVAPAVTWMLAPDYVRSPERLMAFIIGVEGFWYAGR